MAPVQVVIKRMSAIAYVLSGICKDILLVSGGALIWGEVVTLQQVKSAPHDPTESQHGGGGAARKNRGQKNHVLPALCYRSCNRGRSHSDALPAALLADGRSPPLIAPRPTASLLTPRFFK